MGRVATLILVGILVCMAFICAIMVMATLTGCAAEPRWQQPVEYGDGSRIELGAMDEAAWRWKRGERHWMLTQ